MRARTLSRRAASRATSGIAARVVVGDGHRGDACLAARTHEPAGVSVPAGGGVEMQIDHRNDGCQHSVAAVVRSQVEMP
jgi:hypothetical protein